MTPRAATKTAQDELVEALIGEVYVEDASPKDKTLAEHDKEKHPDGFDPKTDTCKFRERIATETEEDKADIENPDAAPKEGSSGKESSDKPLVTPEDDAAYMEAVKNGDMETAQKMVFDAARKVYGDSLIVDNNGQPVVFYHGTNKKITSFDPSKDKNGFGDVYFTDNPEYVKHFGNESMACILVVDNPSEHDFRKEGFSNALTSRYSGHDAAFVHGVMDFTGIEHSEVLMREMNHIKSADPVTYDDNGEVMPLSRRFDGGDDIRGDVSGREEGSKTEEKTQPHKPMGISHIFTGTAANYDKPSLMAIGTGEGSQVYGWGLYGSNQRGVAERYMPNDMLPKIEISYNGNEYFSDELKDIISSAIYRTVDKTYQNGSKEYIAHQEVIDTLEDKAKKVEAIYGKDDYEYGLLEEAISLYKSNPSNWNYRITNLPCLYEQTFFTDREEGDESHLLNWYEPVSNEQLHSIVESAKNDNLATINGDVATLGGDWFEVDLRDSGIEGHEIYSMFSKILGSPKAASEWLAKHGIDGIKYPVDSFGGKSIKNGDEAGWNYVSFRDDNIRIDKKYIDGKKMFDYQELMEKHHSGIDPMAVLSYLTRLDTAEEMASEFARIMESGIIERDKTVQDELYEALVEDADSLKDQTLQEHDKQHHPQGYHEGDTCKFRDKLKTETGTDKADDLDVDSKSDTSSDLDELTPEDREFDQLVTERDSLQKMTTEEIPEEIKRLSDRAVKKEITWDDFFEQRKRLNDEAENNIKKLNKLDKTIEKKFRQSAAAAMPNTKVVGKDGLPMIVFHGTVRPRNDMFSSFSDRPIFAFKQEGLSSQYTHPRRDMWVSPNRTGHVIPLVMNLENPYVVEAKRHLWSNIDVDWSSEPVDTEEICKYAKDHGYDGVIIRQVRDNMFDNDRSAGDEYIAFSSNQVKSCGGLYEMEEGNGLSQDYEVLVSNVGHTKDDGGNVIPLSKRLDLQNNDIRFSSGDGKVDFTDGEKEELERIAKDVERFIPGVKVKISPKPFSPGGDKAIRQFIKGREYGRWRNLVNMFDLGGMPVTVVNGKVVHDANYDDQLVLEHTPVVLQRLGVTDLPIGVNGRMVLKILGKIPTDGNTFHKTSKQDLYTLLSELDNPIAVFDHEHEPDKIVVLTRMIDQNSGSSAHRGQPATLDNDIIPLTLDKESKNHVKAHLITTGFGEYKDGVNRWVRKGLLLYANTDLINQPSVKKWLEITPKDLEKSGLLTQKDFLKEDLGRYKPTSDVPPQIRLLKDDEGVVVGTYNLNTNEITLYPGANADTIAHELCGHATWQYAEQQAKKGDRTLINKMNEVVDSETAKPVWDEVAANYGGENHEIQREEVWAHIVGHKGSKAIAKIRETEKGQKWYQKAWGVVKSAWKGLLSAAGLNRIKTDGIDSMSPDEFSDYMVDQMTSGKTLGRVEKGEGEEARKSIIGQKGAKNLGIGGLKEAKEMQKAGASRKAIWKKTGWWKGKDGKWRVEIPDIRLPKDIRKTIKDNNGKLDRYPLRFLLEDSPEQDDYSFSWEEKPEEFKSEILRAYPELKDIQVTLSPDKSPNDPYEWGSYDNYRREIHLYRVKTRNIAEIERRLTHEIQHAIQKAEGLSFGADSYDWEAYRNSVGEVEARNTQKRFRQDKSETPPWETEDVPEEKQIVGRR